MEQESEKENKFSVENYSIKIKEMSDELKESEREFQKMIVRLIRMHQEREHNTILNIIESFPLSDDQLREKIQRFYLIREEEQEKLSAQEEEEFEQETLKQEKIIVANCTKKIICYAFLFFFCSAICYGLLPPLAKHLSFILFNFVLVIAILCIFTFFQIIKKIQKIFRIFHYRPKKRDVLLSHPD